MPRRFFDFLLGEMDVLSSITITSSSPQDGGSLIHPGGGTRLRGGGQFMQGSASITVTFSRSPFGASGIGHICIVMAQSGSIIVSYTWGRMISPFGPTRS
jgi:hypothetical protein